MMTVMTMATMTDLVVVKVDPQKDASLHIRVQSPQANRQNDADVLTTNKLRARIII